MGRITFDYSRCAGCSACVSVCIRGNLRMEMERPVETGSGMGCFGCGHCLAVCPEGAVSMSDSPDFVPREYRGGPPVSADALEDLLERRRSCRWFTSERVTEDEFSRLLSAASLSPSAANTRDVTLVVVDRRYRDFMRHVAGILRPLRDSNPRIAMFVDHMDDPFAFGPNPFTWEGRQLILAFSRQPEDAVIAMSRVELMACAMGLGGFYCGWIRMADDVDREKLMGFFPDVPSDRVLRCVYVVGHPRTRFRRTVPREPLQTVMM